MKHYGGKLGNSETYLLIVACWFCCYQIIRKLLSDLHINTTQLLYCLFLFVCVECFQFLFILFGPSVTTVIQRQEHKSILYGVICNGETSLGQPFLLFSGLYNRHSPYFVSLSQIIYLWSFCNKSKGKICITWRHNINLFSLN